jgi:hypothetical protein
LIKWWSSDLAETQRQEITKNIRERAANSPHGTILILEDAYNATQEEKKQQLQKKLNAGDELMMRTPLADEAQQKHADKKEAEREQKLLQEWEADAKKLIEERRAAQAPLMRAYAADIAKREKAKRELLAKADVYDNSIWPWLHQPRGWSDDSRELRDRANAILDPDPKKYAAYYIDANGYPQTNDTPEGKREAERFAAIFKYSKLSPAERLVVALENMADKVGPKFQAQLKQRIEELKKPGNLALLVGGLAAGVGLSALGLTPIVGLFGYLFVGAQALDIGKDLYLGVSLALAARTQDDIELAGEYLARGAAKTGVAGVEYVATKTGEKLLVAGAAFIRKKPLAGRPHGGPTHDAAIDAQLGRLKGARDIRKNQAQMNAKGEKVSDYRPDAQWIDENGVRHYYEVSSKTSTADPGRLRANDPNAVIEVYNLDTGRTVTYRPGEAIP